MVKITCDLCKREIKTISAIRVEFCDGEHPHAGATMHKTTDVCETCARRVSAIKVLRSDLEFDDVVEK